jgi:hypothetical protein
MVKEFEMRKAAAAYKRSSTAKSGSIATNDLYKYKIASEIFRKYDITADSTNHGFIILLDWSGSMERNLQSTISQIITLVQFCRRVGIKFEVYGFSDNEYLFVSCTDAIQRRADMDQRHKRRAAALITASDVVIETGYKTSLIKFYSHNMSSRDTEIISRTLYTGEFRYNVEYRLSGTPLIDALQYMNEYISEFRAKYAIQKMTFITLTDGIATGLQFSSRLTGNNRRCFLHSKKLNRYYPFRASSETRFTGPELQRVIMLMMKDTHPSVKFVGFFIVAPTRAKIKDAISPHSTPDFRDTIIEEAFRSMQKEGFAELNLPGYDQYFLIPPTSESTDVSLSAVAADMSAASIARQFSRTLNSATGSRVVANKLIRLIA